MTPATRTRSPFADLWSLDPEVVFLNHGSFGACPKRVLEEQNLWRERLEAEPVRFFVREYYEALDEARSVLAEFVGADPEGLAFVTNATTGVNAVLRSLDLGAEDELVVTDHEYNACRNAIDFVAARSGAKVRVARIPFPIADEQEVLRSILAEVGPRTRLVLIDHITSATGLILPVGKLIRELDKQGVDCLVDGAHAVGQIPLDLSALGAAYYTSNCHKWLCAPKGAAFLYVRADRLAQVRPAVISHGANMPTTERSLYRNEFDWVGTHDPSPYLCVPQAILYLGSLQKGGWAQNMTTNRLTVLCAREELCEGLGIELPAPESMIGALATCPLPPGPAGKASPLYIDPLQDELWNCARIEVPISQWPAPPQRVIRISAQLYNHPDDYRLLQHELLRALSEERG